MSNTTLDKFHLGGLYRITEIKFWLLEMKSYYERVKKIDSVLYLYEINGEIIRLPPISEQPTEDEMFLDLYEGLETIVSLHSREEYFQKTLLEYYSIKKDTEKIKNWILKNEPIWEKDYICFLIDYLDYSESAFHLSLFLYKQETEIFIHRNDFRFTIEFLEIFNKVK